MTPPIPDIAIPAELLPADGRFGSGPSKVRHEAVEALAATGTTYLGTSHRQATARFTVAALRNGIAELLSLPDGYEVALGNGGTTAFWDAATFGLIDQRSQHLSFGEFSAKFAACTAAAPHLGDPEIIESAPGTLPDPKPNPDIDAYCFTHNETSTGVAMPPAALVRPEGGAGVGRRPVDRGAVAGGRRADRAPLGGRPLGTGVPRPGHRPREQPQGPDLQHAGAGDAVPGGAAARVDPAQRRPAVRRRALRPLGRDPLRLGGVPGLCDAVRRRPRPPQPRGGHDRPRRGRPCGHGQRGAASQRHRRHRELPQARPQPAPHRP